MSDTQAQEEIKVGITTYMTINAAAERSGFVVEYVRRLARDGKINSIRIGHQVMVDKASLLEYMRTHEKS